MKRRMMGGTVLIARLMGMGFVVLGLLSLAQMRFGMAGHATTLEIITAVALVLVGAGWLAVVQVFLRFFDQFLSRN